MLSKNSPIALEPRPAALRASGSAFAQITEFHPELATFRRNLHAHPELGFEEVYTSTRLPMRSSFAEWMKCIQGLRKLASLRSSKASRH